MLDADLAEIYGYTTKRLNEQVKGNISKFPEDFMFQTSDEEKDNLRSQFATANTNSMSRSNPYVFTEQGLYMLMTVLSGKLAEKQSIALVRTFKKMKDYIIENQGLIGERVSLIIYEGCGACILLYTEKNFADIINMTYSWHVELAMICMECRKR